MRQLLIQVPRGCGAEALDAARESGGVNLVTLEATDGNDPIDVVIAHVSNDRVGPLLDRLQQLPQLRAVVDPRGVIALRPPANEAPDQVTEVTLRSPVEIFLSTLQSIGSWRGFLGYAAVAGAVAWIGLYTNSIYLLVAAMLIAPFAGPAMTLAIATARGDLPLMGRSVARYVAALLVGIVVAGVLSLVMRQQIATQQMISTSDISVVAVILPLAAGAAGALNLVQSQRSSLVSGAAIGILVAASLAPPAALIGMASVLREWELVRSGVFLLLLQLVGINLAGAAVFRLTGLSAKGVRYSDGRPGVFPIVMVVTLCALVGLLAWQLTGVPSLRRSSLAERAAAVAQQAVYSSGLAAPASISMQFTRSNINGQNTLLGIIYVQRSSATSLSDAAIRQRVTTLVQRQLLDGGFGAAPLVDVVVLDPPAAPSD